ncbi:hypothetical protein M405DRAFT_305293 [Rhizopogon salebrosus TDB-379]|nr:hypothetical protein M405DRAFT_305293 [Rhizopogon salebrosus TDB-379]
MWHVIVTPTPLQDHGCALLCHSRVPHADRQSDEAEARKCVVFESYDELNGKKHTHANTHLAPGNMISVDPAAIWPSLTPFNLSQYASPSSSSPPTPESLSPPAAPYTCATQPHVPDTAKYQHPTMQMVKLFGHNPPFSPVIILFFARSLQAPD